MARKHKEEWEKNRDTARKSRHGIHWCNCCDMCLVGDGEKCPVCGKKQIPKRYKK